MRRTIILAVLALVALPATALAVGDTTDAPQYKNAAKLCKALKKGDPTGFAAKYGSKHNAYGKCVSAQRKDAQKAEAKAEQQRSDNAAKQCKAEQADPNFAAAHGGKTFEQVYGTNPNGQNAFGKCVSGKAKASEEADQAEQAQEVKAELNAAKTCKAERTKDPAAFQKKYGGKRNAFGKCVSSTAKKDVADDPATPEADAS